MPYGTELILDLHKCNSQSEETLDAFFDELCTRLDMKPEDRYYWASEEHEEKDPDTYGISAVQFILTSSIVVHTLPLKAAVYVNIFTCKDFAIEPIKRFVTDWFNGRVAQAKAIQRC